MNPRGVRRRGLRRALAKHISDDLAVELAARAATWPLHEIAIAKVLC